MYTEYRVVWSESVVVVVVAVLVNFPIVHVWSENVSLLASRFDTTV